MTILQMIETYKELGYGGLLIVLTILIGRFLMRSNQACYEKYEKHMKLNRDEMKELTLQMFKIVEKNTSATTSLQKTMTDIYIKKLSS
jgi:hypothetical protein